MLTVTDPVSLHTSHQSILASGLLEIFRNRVLRSLAFMPSSNKQLSFSQNSSNLRVSKTV